MTVFDYTSPMNQIGFQFALNWNLIHIKIFLEVRLNFIGPLLITPGYCFVCNSCNYHVIIRIMRNRSCLNDNVFDSLTIATFTLNAAVWEKILLVQFSQITENAFAQSDYLYGGAVSGSSRFAFVTSFLGRSHFVHPGATISIVASEYEAGFGMDADLIVESAIGHMLVDLSSGVSLSEAETLKMHHESFLNYFVQRLILKPFLYRHIMRKHNLNYNRSCN